MSKITFDIEAVRALVAHAKAATKHRAVFEQPAIPALHFVKDSGIYLMSSGTPIAPPVYGKGYDPDKDGDDVYEACIDAVGGDDFVEVIALSEQLERMLAHPAANGFYIKVTSRSVQCGVSTRKVRKPRPAPTSVKASV